MKSPVYNPHSHCSTTRVEILSRARLARCVISLSPRCSNYYRFDGVARPPMLQVLKLIIIIIIIAIIISLNFLLDSITIMALSKRDIDYTVYR